MPERVEPALRHAVDDLPASIVKRQAERATWIAVAKRQASPKRLPLTISAAPGLAHRRNARLLGMVAAGFMALFAVSAAVMGGLGDPVILALSLVPPAIAGAGALWHGAKARSAPARFNVALSDTGISVERDGAAWSAPLSSFEGVALRSFRTQKANPRARQHRSPAEAKDRVGEEIRLYWVELTHSDPENSIPLWASDKAFASSEGLAAARAFATRLGLPLLSTAGISSVWEG